VAWDILQHRDRVLSNAAEFFRVGTEGRVLCIQGDRSVHGLLVVGRARPLAQPTALASHIAHNNEHYGNVVMTSTRSTIPLSSTHVPERFWTRSRLAA